MSADEWPDLDFPDIRSLPPNPFDDPKFSAAADRLQQQVQKIKDHMPERDMEPYMAETWEYLGLRCGVAASPSSTHACGYVQLPPPLRQAYSWYDDLPYEQIDAHGGLTYGVDGAGWIGFDTGHIGDYWTVENLAPLLDRAQYEELLEVRRIYDEMPGGSVWERWQERSWTVPILKAAVMWLAASVFALEPPRILTAGPQRPALPAGAPTTRRGNSRDGGDT